MYQLFSPATKAPLPTLGFRSPMLGLIAARLKQLDVRLASDPATKSLRPGSLVVGHELGYTLTFRVSAVRDFDSVVSMYQHYLDHGESHWLFPPSWCSTPPTSNQTSVPVGSSSEALRFYQQYFNRDITGEPVRVFLVSPVEADPVIPPYLVADAIASAKPSANASTAGASSPRRHRPRTLLGSIPEEPSPSSVSPNPPLWRRPRALLHQVAATRAAQVEATRAAAKALQSKRKRKASSVRKPVLPPLCPLTAAAVNVVASLSRDSESPCDPSLLERIASDARRLSRARGAAEVTARDVRDAASHIAGGGSAMTDPANIEPDNFDEVVDALQHIRVSALSSLPEGTRVRVLVVGEVNGVIARMFSLAGADVATCDLRPTRTPDIPHFQGDATLIQNRGFDLVICHPPCTYLANSGLTWLHRDPDRWQHVVQNADVFRRMLQTDAPFVAVENSKMHRHGKALIGGFSPTQYVHPWQHGTGHTKPTALYLSDSLPPLPPSCVVEGRIPALARLPPSDDRAEKRSRTYMGIAAAMATQWMPVLLDHVASLDATQSRETVQTTILKAQQATVRHHCHFLVIRTGITTDVVSRHANHQLDTLPSFEVESGMSPAVTALRSLAAGALFPHSWKRELIDAVDLYPSGHTTTTEDTAECLNVHHTWTLRLPPTEQALPLETTPSNLPPWAWHPLRPDTSARHVQNAIDQSALLDTKVIPPTVAAALSSKSTLSAEALPFDPSPIGSHHELSNESTRPWLHQPSRSEPPPPPQPRHARRMRGHWNVWDISSSPKSTRRYGWNPLPQDLGQQIDAHVAISRERLTPIAEESQCNPTPTGAKSEAAAAMYDLRFGLNGLRQLWNMKPQSKAESLRGLGSSPTTKPPPSLPPSASAATKAEWYSSMHQQWMTPENPTKPVTACSAIRSQHPAPDSTAGQNAHEYALTPRSMSSAVSHAMFVKGLRIIQRAQSRKRSDSTYDINCALATTMEPSEAVEESLADSGAGPSVITTGLIERLPTNCDISWRRDAAVAPVSAADGQPLRLQGTAVLSFYLGNTPCRHEFIVVQGKPLLILGNDFLVPRSAKLNFNTDGQGTGKLELTSVTASGATINHHATVTNNPYLPVSAAFVSPSADESPTGDDSAASTGAELPPDSSTGPTSNSLPSAASRIAAEALADGSWTLETSEHLLYSDKPIKLPKRSTVEVSVRAPKSLLGLHPTCLVDRLPNRAGLEDPPQVIPRCAAIENGRITLQIMNTGRSDTTIPANAPIALLDSEYLVHGNLDPDKITEGDPVDFVARLTPELRKVVDAIKIDPHNRLSPDQREIVDQMVAKHVAAFASDPKNPSKTHLMEVELPLIPGATPHRHAASKLGEKGREIVEKHVREMEEKGIIRKSNSAWGSRVVLVSKKDGSVRFCVDYRDLNSKLQLQDSPIPLTVDALDRLASGTGSPDSLFLSTLDLASGFWCLPIKEEDKPLTSFVTHRQKYEFNYLPFGIQSGPSYMCRLMDAALQGLAWETCMPYLDDVGVWSTGTGSTLEDREASSFEQHVDRLGAVFERLKWAGLSMKADKCTLFATSADYLGHVMSRDGLKMDPKKISAIKAIDPTTINDLEKVRSFLGLCSYYRRFISGFSKIASPLHDLTKDGVDVAAVSQTEVCQSAIIQLMDAITSEPVLATPRFDRPFIVSTDAANTEGLGAVLKQLDNDGRERVIAYYGRKLNKHERHYTVTEIELLAAVEAIKNWRPYLWGRKFKLVIDHSALRWLHTMRDTMEGGPASRLMRWILRLQEYDFHVEHKPGQLHKDADGVSRLACPILTARRQLREQRQDTSRSAVNSSYLESKTPDLDVIKDEQCHDPYCVAIANYLVNGNAGDAMDSASLRHATWLAAETCPWDRIDDIRRRHRLRNAKSDPAATATATRRMYVKDDVLYRRINASLSVVVLPRSLVPPILESFHDHLGHPSARRMQSIVGSRFYWPHMARDIDDHCAECHHCTLAKPGPKPRAPKGPDVGRYPFDLCYVDVLDMADTHDYNKTTGAGFRKLLVFADSLTRWVEAIPLHKDPSSEEVLDLFLHHVVTRYGAPRAVVSDQGSNFASNLCHTIMSQCGVDLSHSAAEHHEAAGLVERFNGTLQGMVRATDEGGRHWAHHLPFLLMSYRATANRVTGYSPSMLLYGREIRLPSELSSKSTVDDTSLPASTAEYATRLHHQLVYAWHAAYEATRATQAEAVSDAEATSGPPRSFAVNDRVARRLYGAANNLEAKYAGPYRVEQVLGNGRYRLRDLENRLIVDEFDVSNLRPYRARVDAEELQLDEYLVESILNHRDNRGAREFLIKWRGFNKKEATWEPKIEICRRCAEMVQDYESSSTIQPPSQSRRSRDTTANTAPPVATAPTAPAADNSAVTDSSLPHIAKFERGAWAYGRLVPTQRGPRLTFFTPKHFSATELASDHFEQLRATAAATLYADPTVAAVFHAESSWAPSEHSWFNPLPKTRPTPKPSASTAEPPSRTQQAAKVWFHTTNADGGDSRLLAFHRQDSNPDRLQFDTFGGTMDPKDNGEYNICALRELKEEVILPVSWREDLALTLASYPQGQRLVTLHKQSDNSNHTVAVWVISVATEHAHIWPRMTAQGATEARPHSLSWRSTSTVLQELSEFRFAVPMVEAINSILTELQDESS